MHKLYKPLKLTLVEMTTNNTQTGQALGCAGEKISAIVTRYDGTTFSATLSELRKEQSLRSYNFTCHPVGKKFYSVSLSELFRGIWMCKFLMADFENIVNEVSN